MSWAWTSVGCLVRIAEFRYGKRLSRLAQSRHNFARRNGYCFAASDAFPDAPRESSATHFGHIERRSFVAVAIQPLEVLRGQRQRPDPLSLS